MQRPEHFAGAGSVLLVSLLLSLAGCGGPGERTGGAPLGAPAPTAAGAPDDRIAPAPTSSTTRSSPPTASSSTAPSGTASSTASPTSGRSGRTAQPARTTQRSTSTTTRRTAAATTASAPSCPVPGSVSAAQVLLVRASGSRAEVMACDRRDGQYRRSLGPYTGWVGRNGVAPAGVKREGDGRTPSGVFRLRGGFGTASNPGLSTGWFVVDDADVWVDDPESALYNTHQRLPANGRWASAEKLRISAYRYAQVIGYNEARTPGLGSAIFLHVATGGPTAGCVSLETSDLLAVLRWQGSGAVVVIG